MFLLIYIMMNIKTVFL